jgi:hypothetical protein
MTRLDLKRGGVSARNPVGAVWQAPLTAESIESTSPWTGQVIGSLGVSGVEAVAAVVGLEVAPGLFSVLHGPAGVELWTNLKKITTKWALSEDANWMS